MFFGEISSSENENGIKVEVITFFLYLFPHKKILRLKHIICIWIGICFLCASLQKAGATAVPQSYAGQRAYADSIMDKVIFFAPFYERVVDEYKAELYIKGWANISKKNHLLRFIPSMFRMKKGVREYMMETYSELHYTAPDIYDQKVKASVGTSSELWELDGRLLEYFHINIYSSTLLYDKLLSPLASNAKKFYTYYIDSIMGEAHNREFRIRFMPKSKSFQLVGGYMVVSDNVWSVREIRFSGRSEMLRFNNLVRMGQVGSANEFLPVHFNIDATFRLLGNVIDGSYTAVLDYKEISQKDPAVVRNRTKSKYDLSESYTLLTDTNAYRRDTAHFNKLRPIPLTSHEKKLYEDFFLRRDTLLYKKKPKNKRLEFWGQIGDALVSKYTVDLAKMGSVRCSPLINPARATVSLTVRNLNTTGCLRATVCCVSFPS